MYWALFPLDQHPVNAQDGIIENNVGTISNQRANVAYATPEGKVTHSEQENPDRRIVRTRKLIQEALIELTIQKGFAAVTVRDITEYAGINRATFYRHYVDKFDLLEQYAQEVYQLLDAAVDDEPADTDESDGYKKAAGGLVRMFEHIRAHIKFYGVMLSKNADPDFAEKIQRYVEKRMRPSLPDALTHNKDFETLYLGYVAKGSLAVILWWLDHQAQFSPVEMAELCVRFSVADLGAVLGSSSFISQNDSSDQSSKKRP